MTMRPAEVFYPGIFLLEELDERGWTQIDFAEITGQTTRTINEIIKGKRRITAETAEAIAASLGTSPDFWMNLESSYQLSKVDPKRDDVSRRARLYSIAPIKDMIKRGWIEETSSIDVLEVQVKEFFGLSNLDEEPMPFKVAAKKSNSYARSFEPAQLAWVFRARRMAEMMPLPTTYTRSKLEDAIPSIRVALASATETRKIARLLAEAGVTLVIVQGLPKGKIDGAAFWLDKKPVIAMSLRFDRIDNFAFVLMHEIAHILESEESLDEDLKPTSDDAEPESPAERKANVFSSSTLVPPQKLENLILRTSPLYSERSLMAFAQANVVHPGVVVGQLQHRGEVGYSKFRKLLEPIRDIVTASALTDGWGYSSPS